jgi:endonuclease YncB( thermonuclease family)
MLGASSEIGGRVAFAELERHRYGRTVAIVYVDGIDAGLELLRQGLLIRFSA